MKNNKVICKIVFGLFVLITWTASAASAQQTFNQNVTAQNKSCNSTCSVIDVPGLNNDPNAIIFITPVSRHGIPENLHPIGAYYMYMNKWSVYNLDNVSITEGAQFNVDYYGPSDSGKAFSYKLLPRL